MLQIFMLRVTDSYTVPITGQSQHSLMATYLFFLYVIHKFTYVSRDMVQLKSIILSQVNKKKSGGGVKINKRFLSTNLK